MDRSKIAFVSMLGVFAVFFALGVANEEQRSEDFASSFVPAPLSGNYCSSCIEVINEVETQGCSEVCKLIPNPLAQKLCNLLLNEAKLCQKILEWLKQGFYPDVICEDIGLCAHNSTCVCGVCAAPLYDKRCLSLPNKCPSGEDYKRKPIIPGSGIDVGVGDEAILCADHACSAEYQDCCLTCF